MKYTLSTAIALVMPVAAMANPDFGGELYVGYGEAGIDAGAIYELRLNAKDSFELGNVGTFDYKIEATSRSYDDAMDDFGGAAFNYDIDNDIVDLALSLDMGSAGKIGFTSFNEQVQTPWADGEIRDRGSRAVWPTVRPQFRSLKGYVGTFTDGEIEREYVLTYDNKFGDFGIHIEADPFQKFGEFDLDELTPRNPWDEPAKAMVELTYKHKYAIGTLAANDVGDYKASVRVPIKGTGVMLSATREEMTEHDRFRNVYVAAYRTKDAGIFKGFFGLYATSNVNDAEKFVFSTNWGGENWNLKLATDDDRDVAAELNYKVADNIELLAAWDSGFDTREGWEGGYHSGPPAFTPARDSSFEIGLSMKF